MRTALTQPDPPTIAFFMPICASPVVCIRASRESRRPMTCHSRKVSAIMHVAAPTYAPAGRAPDHVTRIAPALCMPTKKRTPLSATALRRYTTSAHHSANRIPSEPTAISVRLLNSYSLFSSETRRQHGPLHPARGLALTVRTLARRVAEEATAAMAPEPRRFLQTARLWPLRRELPMLSSQTARLLSSVQDVRDNPSILTSGERNSVCLAPLHVVYGQRLCTSTAPV
jgi:hypothetical protein